MECTMNIDSPYPECNATALCQHTGKYYLSIFDEKGNIVDIPIPIVDSSGITVGVQSANKIECDEKQEIHLNFPLKPGFYYAKVFFDDSFQNGIIFQRISLK